MTFTPMIVVHGGGGHTAEDRDGCERAAEIGMAKLKAGEDALSATVAAVVAMEDDPRFNAGTGSELGLDGRTIEMDAGLMDTRGKLAAIAGIQRVKNPILVTRAVAETPLKMLVGDGATKFARCLGFEDYYQITETNREHHRAAVAALKEGEGGDFPQEWHGYDFSRLWPYPASWQAIVDEYGGGTVGAVAVDTEGHFAVATSTGGSTPMILGRLGNTGIVGCGYYAGPAGAVAATGIGEYIIQTMLCRTVYEWLAQGMPLEEALAQGVDLIPKGIDVGIIGVTLDEAATWANTQMPAHILRGPVQAKAGKR